MADLPMHYTTRYTTPGGVSDGVIAIDARPDMPVGSPHDEGRYSPEHLLVAAVEACLANTITIIAARSRLTIHSYRSRAEGELEFVPRAGYRFTRIRVTPELVIDAGSEALARKVVEKSHSACLISRSLNCTVEMEPRIDSR